MTEPVRSGAWVGEDDLALLTDQYQLTMLQAYWREGMEADAVFSLFARRLPEGRNFLLAAGLEQALTALEALRFRDEDLEYLRTLGDFRDDFLDWLAEYRFGGTVHAPPEGTPVFPEEPLLEVTAPIAEAQLVESLLMNQVHLQTVLASKAARVVLAAGDANVVDFGLRRMHGADAGLKAARAFHVAGVGATSHVLAGKVWGVPVTGTMAHSYVQAHDSEEEAFRAFTELYPETILLVDTYDTEEGVRKVVELARELGEDFRVRGVRLDSGDLVELARSSRRILDEAGLDGVKIFASGGLDEYEIARMLDAGAPIDGFGVGTGMGVSKDAPALDTAYKLTEYGGKGRMKFSPGKRIFPGRKQVFRREREGEAVGDVLARADEELEGRPLLREVMREGRIVPGALEELDRIRERAREEISRLPDRVRGLEKADPPYPVEVSDGLRSHQDAVEERIEEETRTQRT